MHIALARAMLTLLLLLAGVSARAESGFLDDYSKLQADAARPGAMSYRAPDADLGKYAKLLIDPIEVVYDPDSPHKLISPDELKLITDAFYRTLIAELEPIYPVVDTPGLHSAHRGGDSARISAAIFATGSVLAAHRAR